LANLYSSAKKAWGTKICKQLAKLKNIFTKTCKNHQDFVLQLLTAKQGDSSRILGRIKDISSKWWIWKMLSVID